MKTWWISSAALHRGTARRTSWYHGIPELIEKLKVAYLFNYFINYLLMTSSIMKISNTGTKYLFICLVCSIPSRDTPERIACSDLELNSRLNVTQLDPQSSLIYL